MEPICHSEAEPFYTVWRAMASITCGHTAGCNPWPIPSMISNLAPVWVGADGRRREYGAAGDAAMVQVRPRR